VSTIGGVVAANASGPRRVQAGACRDALIGVRFVDGRGQVVKNGGRVMKNVTGYDLVKLMAGSHGVLGVLSEVSFKVQAMPEAEATLVDRGAGRCGGAGGAAARAWVALRRLGRGAGGGAVADPGRGDGGLGRLSGRASAGAGLAADVTVAEGAESAALWREVRDVAALAGRPGDLWRLALLPTAAAGVAAALGGEAVFDWGGGLVWLCLPEGQDAAVRAAVAGRGRGTLMRGAGASPLPPEAPEVAALSAGLKAQFDPRGILNPGIDLMQTTFTPEQLKDPGIARANEILRSCVHCGFCTATCPTYQVLGDELDSPRGRIYLIKDMLEAGRPADEKTVKHIDRCLSCLACMTTCPSGVHYMHLIDHARAHVEKTYRRPLMDRLLRAVLARVIPYPGRFRLALLGAKIARPFAAADAGCPAAGDAGDGAEAHPAGQPQRRPAGLSGTGERRMRVALLTGCAQKALNTDINDATIRLLRRLGCEVVVARGRAAAGR
jgi:heterodisulfide reductase subunit C